MFDYDVTVIGAGRFFFWFGLAATIAVTVFVTHLARKTLKQRVEA